MQEQVNQTLEQLSKPMEFNAGPTLKEIEDKINRRMAGASARAELESSSIEGAQRDVERSLAQASAQVRLDKLREELGLPAPRPPVSRSGQGRGAGRRRGAGRGQAGRAARAGLSRVRRAPPGCGGSARSRTAGTARRRRAPRSAPWSPPGRRPSTRSATTTTPAPASTITSSACWAPAPPGVIGSSVEIDPTTSTSSALVIVACTSNASSRKYAVPSRQHQPSAW